jgi:hypothetical protein
MAKQATLLVSAVLVVTGCYVEDASSPALVARSSAVTPLGCFRDQGEPGGPKGRDVDGLMLTTPAMTTELCTETCAFRGYPFAATQDSVQCFCGFGYGHSGSSDACTMRCGGNPNETCGGSWANSVYQIR